MPDPPNTPLGGHVFLDPRDRLRIRRAEETGDPFEFHLDDHDRLCLTTLHGDAPVVVGRSSTATITLGWDPRVSGRHAVLECLAGEWVVIDNDSTNGTLVDGRRVVDRRRLIDGSVITMGHTRLVFRDPTPRTGATVPANLCTAERFLNATQRRVLAALCEPSLLAGELRAPPSNADVAARIHRGVETVRTGMGALYKAFEITGEDGAAKRMRLVETAVRMGAAHLSVLDD